MADQGSLNPQIAQAVESTNRVVQETARQAATAIAFQEIAQSMAIAVQTGVDHLESAFTLNVATTGSAFARVLEDPGRSADLQAVLEASQGTVNDAIASLSQLAREAAKALNEFPGDQGAPEAVAPKAAVRPASPPRTPPKAKGGSKGK